MKEIMSIIKKIIETRELIVIVLTLTTLISCGDNDLLYKIIVYSPKSMDNYYDQSPVIIPICNNKDSVYCCTTPSSFYNKIGILILTEEEFSKKLYNKIITNKFIQVSDNVYNEIKNDGDIVIEDEELLEIYKSEGIFNILNKYTDENGGIDYKKTSIERINYIYYLAFINNIHFYWADEGGPGYFLDNTILNQIKKNSD